MKYSIGKTISKAIKENKWISIEYTNKDKENSKFWCAINNINILKKQFSIDMFNMFKNSECKENVCIYFDKIISAKVIEQTYYEYPPKLIETIESNLPLLDWLEFDNFNDKILEYYSEAKRLDVDPYQSDYANVRGIDARLLLKDKKIKLTDEQFIKIAKDIYKNEEIEKKNKFSQLAINKISIDSKGKKYVVAYYPLTIDVKKKELAIKDDLIVNKSFIIDENKYSLSQYLTIDPTEFINLLNNNYSEAKFLLEDNLRDFEKIEENPLIMLISADINIEYDTIYESIAKKHKENKLEAPMKAFFSALTKRNKGKKDPLIVLMDDKADIDQIRVVYNAMKQPITYVQGPPGTGKTTTLMNVVLSSFMANQTCLVCSNNNHPLDDIIKKFNFMYKGRKILFPIIRLGNREEITKSLEQITSLYLYDDENIKIFDKALDELNQKSTNKYKDLKELISQYEKKKNNVINKEYFDKYLLYVTKKANSSEKLKNKIRDKIEELNKEINQIPDVSIEDVQSKVISLKNDENFLKYLYYKSFSYIKELKRNYLSDLHKILKQENKGQKTTEFIKWLKTNDNFKKFQKIFPVIVCTNISCLKLGDTDSYFDIGIMDEAGQCDVAASLIPISKCKRLLLVGDVNQLQPVITIDDDLNNKLMQRFEVPKEYDYCHNSIMNLMTRVDNVSPQILLSYHYRCGHKIASFSNQRYYDGKLNIKTELNGTQLEYVKVNNDFFGNERNSYEAEALAVVDYIENNKLEENKVTIITPFRNQAALINKELNNRNLKVKCGTIHTVQGAENDVVIFSPAIGLKSSKKTYEWLANNKELINVAVTRAKNRLVFVSDENALEINANKQIEDDIIALSNYVKENGNTTISKSQVNKIDIGLSNGSENENELFETLTQFCSVHKQFLVKRNKKISEILKKEDENELKLYFQSGEFDTVIYSYTFFGAKIPKIVIELNGGEHYISKSQSIINDKKKMEICKKNNLKYISIPNKSTKSYETLADLITALSNDKNFEQMSLLSEE